MCFNFDDESYEYVNTNTFEGFLRTWAGCYYNSLSTQDVLSMLDDPTVRAHVTRNEIVFIDGVLRKWICDKIRTNNLELVIHVDDFGFVRRV